MTALGPSRVALLQDQEIMVVDLEARRGARLTLPEADDDLYLDLVGDGGLGTVARRAASKDVKLVVYDQPSDL
jgi:hypothetical protein